MTTAKEPCELDISLGASINALADFLFRMEKSDGRIESMLQHYLPDFLSGCKGNVLDALFSLSNCLLFEGILDMMKKKAPGSRIPLSRIADEFNLRSDLDIWQAMFSDENPIIEDRKAGTREHRSSLVGTGEKMGGYQLVKWAPPQATKGIAN